MALRRSLSPLRLEQLRRVGAETHQLPVALVIQGGGPCAPAFRFVRQFQQLLVLAGSEVPTRIKWPGRGAEVKALGDPVNRVT